MQLSEEEVKKFINGEKIDYKPLSDVMEEIASMPSEGPPVRQPGEKCMYELNKKKLVEDMAKTNSPYYDP